MKDKMFPDLYRFVNLMNQKNKDNKLIIIYHDHEKTGTTWAKLFYEKGYENIYLLSGGLETFCEQFHDFLEGKVVPQPILLKGLYF